MSKTLRYMINFVLILLVFYLAVCLLLFWTQEKFIFFPTKLPQNFVFSTYKNIEEHYFKIDDGDIHALYFKVDQPKGIILYFHGNSQALESWGQVAEDFRKLDYEVFMPDYRTYGKSTGSMSEANLYFDARLVYDFLLTKYPASKIIIYGRSLGSGIATDLATKVKAKALIIETPYTSMPDIAAKKIPFIPVRYIMRYQFDNLSKIDKVNEEVHIIAATNDQLTPYDHAVQLAEKTGKSKEVLTTIHGANHNNIAEFIDYHNKLKSILH